MKKTIILSVMILFLSSVSFLSNAQQSSKNKTSDVANITVTHTLSGDAEMLIKFATSSEFISIDKGNGNVEKVALNDLESMDKWKVLKFTPSGKTIKIFDSEFRKFSCMRGNITSIDVSNCPKLDYLYCAYNSLKTIDVSKNPALIILNCAKNELTSIVLKDNTKLHSINADRNYLDAAAITDIFNNLPDRSQLTKKGKFTLYRDHRSERNATNLSNTSVATDKGWEIVTI